LERGFLTFGGYIISHPVEEKSRDNIIVFISNGKIDWQGIK
jgi:hypothetical protein